MLDVATWLGGVLAGATIAYGVLAPRLKSRKGLRHIVAFEFKAGTTESDKQGVTDRFRALAKALPELVTEFECGVNNSPEGFNEG